MRFVSSISVSAAAIALVAVSTVAATQPIVPLDYFIVPLYGGGNCANGNLDCPNGGTPHIDKAGMTAIIPQGPSTAPAGPAAPKIHIPGIGSTTGTITHNGAVNSYYSVPYASNKVRFLPAEYPTVFGDHDGTQTTPLCTQGDGRTGVEFDCLWFTIHVPSNTSAMPVGGWPVFVFYPGGSFVNTVNNDMGYMTATNQNIIGIYGAYRVGPYAYLALTGLSKEMGALTGIEGSGAISTLDQQAGLMWVQDNIAAFGGNAMKVTVGGESAGSWSTCLLLTSPLSAGLFQQAILESGTCDAGPANEMVLLDHAENNGQLVATLAGCDLNTAPISGNHIEQMKCMRAVSTYDLTLASINSGGEVIGLDHMTTPVVDGYTQPVPPQFAFWAGTWMQVPLLLGSNLFETYPFNLVYEDNEPGSFKYSDVAVAMANYTHAYSCSTPGSCAGADEVAIAAIIDYCGANSSFSQYGDVYGPYYSVNVLGSAGSLQCGMRRMAEHAYNVNVPSYLYNYRLRAGSALNDAYGPVHGLETIVVYGNGVTPFTADEIKIVNVLSAYWTNFVANCDPNINTGNVQAATGSDRLMPTNNFPVSLDLMSQKQPFAWTEWPMYDPRSHASLQIGDWQVVGNYTTWVQSYFDTLPICPLFDTVMPGGNDHTVVTFTPRLYSGYNQPGFNLAPIGSSSSQPGASTGTLVNNNNSSNSSSGGDYMGPTGNSTSTDNSSSSNNGGQSVTAPLSASSKNIDSSATAVTAAFSVVSVLAAALLVL